MATDNKTLGRFILSGIAPAHRGIPQVEVSFDIDANGILNVKAKDKGTNKEQSITITASSGLSKDEIERMTKDAELHAEEDKKKREAADVKNQADTLLFTTERFLRENDKKISDTDKKDLSEKLDAVRKVKDGSDLAAIQKAVSELSTVAQNVGARMYKEEKTETSGQDPQNTSQPSEAKADEPVEGSYEDVPDNEQKGQ